VKSNAFEAANEPVSVARSVSGGENYMADSETRAKNGGERRAKARRNGGDNGVAGEKWRICGENDGVKSVASEHQRGKLAPASESGDAAGEIKLSISWAQPA